MGNRGSERIMLVLNLLIMSTGVLAMYTTRPPCCRDHLGSPACHRLQKTNPRYFARRCNTDTEFRLMQCCSACNKSGEAIAYDLIARSLVDQHCFDRYGPSFCSRYVNGTDVFEPQTTWTCDGENPQIAFRSCRKSCGFCNFAIVHYTLDNALKSCKNDRKNWRNMLVSTKKMHSEELLEHEDVNYSRD